MPKDALEMRRELAPLEALPDLTDERLAGRTEGRVVFDVNG